MPVILTNIETLVRPLVGDFSTAGIDIFTYGASAVFTLTEPNVITPLTAVLTNEVESGTTFTFDSSVNKMTVTSSLSSGDTVQATYNFYPNYSSTEITNYIQGALSHISINNYATYIITGSTDEIHPEPTEREKHLIAVVTSLLMKPDNRTIRLPDMTITVPKDLPTNKKIAATISHFKRNIHGIFSIA